MRLSSIEKQLSKPTLTYPISTPLDTAEEVNITWDIIDKSTENYAKLLQEYDIAEIVKSFLQRYGKSKQFAMLPKPGNLDLSDKVLNFNGFYTLLEDTKQKYPKHDLSKASQEEHRALEDAAEPILNYFLTGKHPTATKQFLGWKQAFSRNSKTKNILGIISIDLPMAYHTPKHNTRKYKCSGTQHYVAFAYDPRVNKLYIFDSASKDPNADHSEVVYLLTYTFQRLSKSTPPEVEGLVFRNVLQPGAGDKKEEDERSYNNQNVFCHTWSLWFTLVFMCFYECDAHQICLPALRFIRSLSHRNNLFNLAMIKRFAGWITMFLEEEDSTNDAAASKKFAVRAYHRAKEVQDDKRLQEVLSMYALAKDPYFGLFYIYNATNKQYISVDRLYLRRKVKMDIDILDTLEDLDIQNYTMKSKEIRCPVDKVLNTATKRCRKVQST